jgi:serine protease Do
MKLWTSAGKRAATSVLAVSLLLCLRTTGAAEGELALEVAPAAAPDSAAAPAPIPSLITPELMRSVRAATFEVVLKKPEADPLQYEKPLPLELIPFAERNDKYRSIGTAFAIAAGTFVTAAHVTGAASGSMAGVPALRDAQGNVYPIDRVTRFSLHEDFIVFTVSGAPKVTPLSTSTEYQFDTAVFAVGNALGQGIVARDGTLTSETPEDQDGRWKWLRFSAPASPGNSGGPLLDAKGRVIGLISRKSANENLNFALPIALVLGAPDNKAGIDTRYTASLPFMTARKTVNVRVSFDLPLRFADFDRKLIAVNDEQIGAARRALLQEAAASLYPRGKSARLLADPLLNSNPALITQLADGTWDVPRTAAAGSGGAQLGTDGSVWLHAQAGVTLFRLRYPGGTDIAKARSDSRALSENVLKGANLSRSIGSERVRITSFGDAGKPQEFKDDFGRPWLQWRYPLPFADSTMIVMALPTPEGFVGLWRSTGGAGVERTAAELRQLTNFLQVSYNGTLPQWRAFLADARLRPDSFGRWKAALDPAGEISLELPRLAVKIDRTVLALTDGSLLSIIPATMLDGDRPAWDVHALSFSVGPGRSQGIGAVRRARPAADAGQVPVRRWDDMTKSAGPYSGNPQRSNNGGTARVAAGAAGTPSAEAKFLYELTYTTNTEVQGEVRRAIAQVPQMFTVLEK